MAHNKPLSEDTAMKYDDIYEEIGSFGLFQTYIFTLVSMFSFWSYQANASQFVLFPMEHSCQVPGLSYLSWQHQKYVAVPVDERGDYDRCHR